MDNKFHLTTDDNGSTSISAGESSYTATEGDSHVLIEEAEESQKEISSLIARWMARMLGLLSVVGKLIIWMILGNVFAFTGWGFFDFLSRSQ